MIGTSEGSGLTISVAAPGEAAEHENQLMGW